MRRLLGVVVAAALSVAVAPAASAEEEYPVVGGVVRDNVDKSHSPRMAEEFDGPAPRMAAAADYVRGIDVSKWQHDTPIDWSQVAGSGIRFVGVKATEGNYNQNIHYPDDMSGAQAAGMYSYAYHFATPNDSSGLVQADYFLNYANFTPNGKTLRPVLDVEWNPYGDACYGKTKAQLVSWIQEFVNRVKFRTGLEPMIYTSASWWGQCVGSTAFGAYPLWVASYTETPAVPTGWSTWDLWQYSDKTTVPGITGEVDGNYVRGGEAALAALATKASTPSGYTSIAPTRVLDTRSAIGVPTTTPVGTRGTVTLDLSARIPATATAAVLNVTAIAGSATFVTVWPAGSTRPISSNLNLAAGDIRPNLVTVQLNADRKVVLYNNYGSTHLIADLAGWYDTTAAGLYTALSPQRALDTRSTAPVGARGKVTLNLSARVPDTATAVTINLTGVGATASTFVSAYPTGTTRSSASNLNLANASPTSNLVTVQLGTNRSIDLYNHNGSVHLIADLAGYYSPGTGAKFVALSPMRVIDTRVNATTWTTVSGGGSAFTLNMSGPIPAGATAAVMNVTGVSPTLATYLAVSPKTSTTPTRPSTSNVQLAKGQILPNLVSVALGPNRDVWMFNNSGSVGVIADLAGYFAP